MACHNLYILIASKKLKLLFKCYFECKDSIFLTEFKLLVFQVFINKKTCYIIITQQVSFSYEFQLYFIYFIRFPNFKWHYKSYFITRFGYVIFDAVYQHRAHLHFLVSSCRTCYKNRISRF